jgi:hypothetical protein
MTSAHAPIVAAATALLSWSHRRGGQARTLVRLRTIRTDVGLATAVVASELRDSPRGHEIGSDFAALANTALRQLIPAAVPPQAVVWYAHHGEFSSYDPSGPETLTKIDLRWDGEQYLDPTPTDHHLLSTHQFTEYSALLQLEPVDALLSQWTWDGAPVPGPRPPGR